MSRYQRFKNEIKEKYPEKYVKLNFNKVDDRLYYIYRVTNIKNNTFYYGSRVSNRFDILDGYYTSSKMKNSIKENLNDYTTKIVIYFDNSGDKILYEAFLHSFFNVKEHSRFWNKANQTPFNFDTTNIPSHGGKHTDETKKLLSEINKGVTWENKVGKEKAIKLKEDLKKRNSLRSGNNHPMFGKPSKFKNHSEETKKKLSENKKGKSYEEIFGEEKGKQLKEKRKGGGNPKAKSITLFDKSDNKICHYDNIKDFYDFCRNNNYPSGLFKKNIKEKKQIYKPTSNSPKRFREFENWYVIIS